MNPDIERVQHYLAISQKVSESEHQQKKRRSKKQHCPHPPVDMPPIEGQKTNEETEDGEEQPNAYPSENHLDITA